MPLYCIVFHLSQYKLILGFFLQIHLLIPHIEEFLSIPHMETRRVRSLNLSYLKRALIG